MAHLCGWLPQLQLQDQPWWCLVDACHVGLNDIVSTAWSMLAVDRTIIVDQATRKTCEGVWEHNSWSEEIWLTNGRKLRMTFINKICTLAPFALVYRAGWIWIQRRRDNVHWKTLVVRCSRLDRWALVCWRCDEVYNPACRKNKLRKENNTTDNKSSSHLKFRELSQTALNQNLD